jgi:HK97 family phage major capsid protein
MASKIETIKTPALRRALTIKREDVKDDRSVPLSFSSEAPLYDPCLNAVVILDHSPGCCDLSRMQGGPVLVQHNRNDQVGAAEACEIKDGKGYAVARFSKSARGEEIFQDVKDGIRRQVSVDAVLNKIVLESVKDGVKTIRAVSWTPVEISIVSVAADNSVGIARDDKSPQYDTQFETPDNMKLLLDPKPTDAGAPTEQQLVVIRAEGATAETNRIQKILDAQDAFAKNHPNGTAKFGEIARAAIKEKKPIDEVQLEMLRAVPGLQEVDVTDPKIGMSPKEVKRFSLMKAVREMAFGKGLTGLEKEACEATQKHLKRELSDAKAIVVPEDICDYGRNRLLRSMQMEMISRAQTAGVFSAGGAVVQEQYGPMIELLRNQTVLGRAGITVLSGLVGDLILPVHTGGATAYWVSETGALSDTAATFGQKSMVPHRLGATIPFSTQFLAQASISAEDFLRNELMTAMNLKKDVAGLHGSGAAGEPLGVQNTTGINATVTYSDAAAWADVVEHETGICVDNADIGTMAFILSAATVGKWKTKLKDSVAGAGYLIEGGGENMSANGYKAHRSNQVAGNVSFFGVWAQLLLGGWAGLEVIVDPYALKKSGQVEITMNELCDFLARQPLAFNVSTDSAAQ